MEQAAESLIASPALVEACRKYRVKELAVFGSAARGELQPGSDIDLLVEFLPEAGIGLFELWELSDELERVLGRRVDLVPKGALKKAIRSAILAESRLV